MSSRQFFDEISRRYGEPEIFVDRVVEAMRAHGITQKKLADRSGVHITHLSSWIGKSRRTVPRLESMVTIDEALEELILEAASS